jgi:formylglycine-generating enzyme required for sulfatase activity
MGSPDGVGNDKERPRHQVSVPSFYIGKYEVTLDEYEAVMGKNPAPSVLIWDGKPVEFVSWDNAKEFCRRLSRMTGRKYRLPTEAEWEYACRAGTTTAFAFGDTLTLTYANFDNRSSAAPPPDGGWIGQTTPAATAFGPNAWGLYDMHGNVWEWCEDTYHDSYEGAPGDGSAWVSGNPRQRILRGGAWDSVADNCRSAVRHSAAQEGNIFGVDFRVAGFRVAADLEK